MAVDYTTTALLTNVKRKCQIPTGDTKLSDANILAIADEEMRSYVIPNLLQTGQDYYSTQCTIAIVANQQDYLLPIPANASTIVNVGVVLANGRIQPLHRVATDHIDQWASDTGTIPQEYAIQGNRIVVLPTPTDATASLRVQFEESPGRLVATTDCRLVTGVAGSVISFGSAPPAAWTATSIVSCVMSGPPFGTRWGYADVSAVGATDVTVGTPMWGDVADTSYSTMYADYVCAWNETCVVPLPEAWHPVMLYAASSTVAREYGDTGLADYLRQEVDVRIGRMVASANNRVRLDAPIVFNRSSPMRSGWSGRYGG